MSASASAAERHDSGSELMNVDGMRFRLMRVGMPEILARREFPDASVMGSYSSVKASSQYYNSGMHVNDILYRCV